MVDLLFLYIFINVTHQFITALKHCALKCIIKFMKILLRN